MRLWRFCEADGLSNAVVMAETEKKAIIKFKKRLSETSAWNNETFIKENFEIIEWTENDDTEGVLYFY